MIDVVVHAAQSRRYRNFPADSREMFDVNVYQENIFHTKMHIKDFDLDTYLFEANADDLSFKERARIEQLLKREIEELFHGRNLM